MSPNSINKIICGDFKDILPNIDENSVDLTLTSPPYDKLRDYSGYHFDYKILVEELWRITKQGGVIVWVTGDSTIKGSETGTSFKQALYFKQIGFNIHDTMIYEKSGFSFPSQNRYHQIFEYMFVFSKGKPKTFNPIKDKKNKSEYTFSKKRRNKDGSMSHNGDTSRISVAPYGMRSNIWRYKTGKGNSTKDDFAFDHPAIFPEDLARDHILSWTNVGDLVLDPMVGSGTTAKIAKLLNRNYIGIEISKKYCKIAEKRIKII